MKKFEVLTKNMWNFPIIFSSNICIHQMSYSKSTIVLEEGGLKNFLLIGTATNQNPMKNESFIDENNLVPINWKRVVTKIIFHVDINYGLLNYY